jgi:hypothetical protein
MFGFVQRGIGAGNQFILRFTMLGVSGKADGCTL